MQVDIFNIITKKYFLYEKELNTTKNDIFSHLKQNNLFYNIEMIDIEDNRGCIFIYNTQDNNRIQVLFCENIVLNIFYDVCDKNYIYKNKKVKNIGIDNLIKEFKKDNVSWEIKTSSKNEIILKVQNILFYFDYELKFPLCRIEYNP